MTADAWAIIIGALIAIPVAGVTIVVLHRTSRRGDGAHTGRKPRGKP